MQIFIQTIIVGQELVDQVVLVPHADLEEQPGHLALDRRLEATPAHEQALIGPDVLHGADQLIQHRPFQRGVLALDLHTDPWVAEAERVGRGKDVDAAVGPLGAVVGGETLGLQDGFDEDFQTMPAVLAVDQSGDLVTGDLLDVEVLFDRVGIVASIATSASSSRQWGNPDRLPPVALHGTHPILDVVPFDLADRGEGTERVEDVLVEVGAGDVGLQPLHSSVVVVRILAFGVMGVVAGDLADVDGLSFAGDDHPVAGFHAVAEDPDLASVLDMVLSFLVWVCFFEDLKQGSTILDLAQIVIESSPSEVDSAILKEFGFVFAMSAGAGQPERHAFISFVSCRGGTRAVNTEPHVRPEASGLPLSWI